MGNQRSFRKGFKSTVIGLVLSGVAFSTFASRPEREGKDFAYCEATLAKGSTHRSQDYPSASSLIPLNVLLSSRKSSFVSWMWRLDPFQARSYTSPGMSIMYGKSDEAVTKILEKLNLSHVSEVRLDPRAPWAAAEATLKLMRQKDPPPYIKNGVLIRDLVVQRVPLLKLDQQRWKKKKEIHYTPVVVKGHQDLREDDLIAATTAAWALQKYQKEIPATAEVFLVPMVQKRSTRPSTKGHFTVEVKNYLPVVESMVEDFLFEAAEAAAADPDKILALTPKRRVDVKSPWTPYMLEKLKQADHLTMMPLPPTEEYLEGFSKIGIQTMKDLSKLDVNSPKFLEVAVTLGVSPYRLLYWVSHAKAITRGEPIVVKPYSDPLADAKYIVHIDFEDFMHRDLKSGVYLFGTEIQGKRVASRPLLKKFHFAESLAQKDIEQAWVDFIRFFKTDSRLKKGDFKITTYSKHELVMFYRELDILEQKSELFTAAEQKSEFYSEYQENGKSVGRLMRNTEFFKRHRSVKPEDVYSIMDRMVDLLDFVRGNLAFPTYSNGIKKLVPYLGSKTEKLQYASDANGLNSMAWVLAYFTSLNPHTKQKIIDYNELDIDGNRVVSDFVRRMALSPVEPSLRLNKATEANFEKAEKAAGLRRLVSHHLERQSLISAALGKPIHKLSETQTQELKKILDRSVYLKRRVEIRRNQNLSDDETGAMLQFEKHQFARQRTSALFDFFTRVNPKLRKSNGGDAAEAFVTLLEKPAQWLTPSHVDELAVFEDIMLEASRHVPRRPSYSLDIPAKYMSAFEKIADEYSDIKQAKHFWQGLYFYFAFPQE